MISLRLTLWIMGLSAIFMAAIAGPGALRSCEDSFDFVEGP